MQVPPLNSPILSNASSPKTVRITIFQTSDEHGHIENAGRIAKIIDDARKQNPDGVLYVSSGDFFTGSSTFNLEGLQPSIDAANLGGLSEMAIGDHDVAPGDKSWQGLNTRGISNWQPGDNFLSQWVPKFQAKVLATNVVDGQTGAIPSGTVPFDIQTVKGIKLGFFGLTTQTTSGIIPPEQLDGLRFTDPTAAAQTAVASLHQQGVNLNFALAHLDDAENQKLAENVPGIEILGGHSHEAWAQPKVIDSDDVSHPGSYRNSLNRIDLDVDPTTGKAVNVQYSLIQVDPAAAEDDVVAPMAHRVAAEMDKVLDEPVGLLNRSLKHDDAKPDQIDPILTHVMLDATHADLAVINKKYVRDGLPAGQTTRRNLINSIPFDNTLSTDDVSVVELNKMLNDSVGRANQTSLTWQFAGAPGSQKDEPAYAFTNGAIVDTKTGQPLSGDEKLKLATDDYLLKGGLDYLPRNEHSDAPTDPNLREVFGQYLAREGGGW